MYKQNQVLVDLLQPVVSALGYEIWGVERAMQGRSQLVRIYIDSASGITLDDCQLVSNQVEGVLDVKDPILGSYQLEVSSPGLERLLFSLEQFRQFIGYQVRISLNRKLDGRKNLSGVIDTVTENTVIILDGGERRSVSEDMIERAYLKQ